MTGAGRAAETAVRGAEPLGPMVAGELERPPLPLLSLEVTVEFCDIEGGRNRGELAEAVPDFHGEVRHFARRQRPPLLSQQGREGPYRRPACRQATQEVARLALRRRGSRRRGRQVERPMSCAPCSCRALFQAARPTGRGGQDWASASPAVWNELLRSSSCRGRSATPLRAHGLGLIVTSGVFCLRIS